MYVVKGVAMKESTLQSCSWPECQNGFAEKSNRKDQKANKEILLRFEIETTGILLCIALSFWRL